MMYVNGNGITQNEEKAIHWFQKAANQGFDRAKINLAKLKQI